MICIDRWPTTVKVLKVIWMIYAKSKTSLLLPKDFSWINVVCSLWLKQEVAWSRILISLNQRRDGQTSFLLPLLLFKIRSFKSDWTIRFTSLNILIIHLSSLSLGNHLSYHYCDEVHHLHSVPEMFVQEEIRNRSSSHLTNGTSSYFIQEEM